MYCYRTKFNTTDFDQSLLTQLILGCTVVDQQHVGGSTSSHNRSSEKGNTSVKTVKVILIALGIMWELALACRTCQESIRPNRWAQNHAATAGTWGKGNRTNGSTICDWEFSSRNNLVCVPGGGGILTGMISCISIR